jgi:hypothetical protein
VTLHRAFDLAHQSGAQRRRIGSGVILDVRLSGS